MLASIARGRPQMHEPIVFTTRDVGAGRVRFTGTFVLSKAAGERIAALIAEEDRATPDLTIDTLAAELRLSRRTIERALIDGTLVPSHYKGKRARFTRVH